MERRRLADTLPTTHTRLFDDEPSPLHRISDFRLPQRHNPQRQPEKTKPFGLSQTVFYWIDWLSGCLTLHYYLILPLFPLRPAERSILFSGKSVRLSDDTRSVASSHAPKKGCGVREVWRSQTCTSGSPFFCLLFFGEAKKSKCPAGMKRMVKAKRMLTTKHQLKAWCAAQRTF